MFWCMLTFSYLTSKEHITDQLRNSYLDRCPQANESVPSVVHKNLWSFSQSRFKGSTISRWFQIVIILRHWKMTSSVNAPASLKSSLVSTQYILWGQGRDEGRGRGTVVLKMYSRPVGGGKSWACVAGCRCWQRWSENEETEWRNQTTKKIFDVVFWTRKLILNVVEAKIY